MLQLSSHRVSTKASMTSPNFASLNSFSMLPELFVDALREQKLGFREVKKDGFQQFGGVEDLRSSF